MQDIESFSQPEGGTSAAPTAEPPRGFEPRSVLRSLNAVVYDWDIASDRLIWGANVGETLAAFSSDSLASGAAFAELVTADSESSRFQAISNASERDEGEGAPYRALYRLARADRTSCAVEDFGR